MNRQRWLIVVGALLLLWLLIPTTDLVSPDWDVLVTDVDGAPLADVSVTDSSRQYTFESASTDVTKTTGNDGRAHFDPRRIRALGLQRLIGFVRGLGQGAHASFGVHTHIFPNLPGYGEPFKLSIFIQNDRDSTYHGGQHQSSHLILQKCPPAIGFNPCPLPGPDIP